MYLPHKCITASSLHSLANALNRLHAWHKSHGGQSEDEPCLRTIEVDPDTNEIRAVITSGKLHWDLTYVNGEWHFKSEALKDSI